MFSRRKLLTTMGMAGSLLALAACTVSSGNGVTQVTINVTEVKAYANTAEAVLVTLLTGGNVPVAISQAVSQADGIIQEAITSFMAEAGSTASYTFDTTSVPAFLTALVTDIQQASAIVAAASTSANVAKGLQVANDIASIAGIIASIWAGVAAPEGQTAQQARVQKIAIIRSRYHL